MASSAPQARTELSESLDFSAFRDQLLAVVKGYLVRMEKETEQPVTQTDVDDLAGVLRKNRSALILDDEYKKRFKGEIIRETREIFGYVLDLDLETKGTVPHADALALLQMVD